MYFWDKHKTITTYYELLSQMEYDILMFPHNNPQYNTAAEIVKIRKSTKSHVSTSLKNLESKGLVERIQSKDNKKHIEIALLDQAEIIIEAGLNAQKQFAQNVLRGLTEEEIRLCIRVFDKICNNAEEQLKNYQLDIAIIGAAAIGTDGKLYDGYSPEARLKSSLFSVAKKVYVLADSSKINTYDLNEFGSLSQIDGLITDAGIDEEGMILMKRHRVNVMIAE